MNADGFLATGQGVPGTNMFVYCGNNPVNLKDPTGRSSVWAIGGFFETAETAFKEIGKIMRDMSGAYAGCGATAATDGPLLVMDVIALGIAGTLTIGAIGQGIYNSVQNQTGSASKDKEEVVTKSAIKQKNIGVLHYKMAL